MRLARASAYALASLAEAPDAPDRCLGKPTTTSTTSCVTTSPASRSRSLPSFARRSVSSGLARVPVASERATPTRTVPTSTPSLLPGTQLPLISAPIPAAVHPAAGVLAGIASGPGSGHPGRITAEVELPGLRRGTGRAGRRERWQRDGHLFGPVRSVGLLSWQGWVRRHPPGHGGPAGLRNRLRSRPRAGGVGRAAHEVAAPTACSTAARAAGIPAGSAPPPCATSG